MDSVSSIVARRATWMCVACISTCLVLGEQRSYAETEDLNAAIAKVRSLTKAGSYDMADKLLRDRFPVGSYDAHSVLSAEVSECTGKLDEHRGLYVEAIVQFRQAIATRERIADPSSPSVTLATWDRFSLAEDLMRCDETEEAIRHYLRVLQSVSSSGDFSESDRYLAVTNIGTRLALAYEALGSFWKAELMFNALTLRVAKTFGAESNRYSIIIGEIGNLYEKEGRFPEALNYLNQSLQLGEKPGGMPNDGIAMLYLQVGNCHRRLGKLANAEQAYLSTKRYSVNAPDKRFDILADIGLSFLLLDKGRYQEGNDSFQHCLYMADKLFSAQCPPMASIYFGLGESLRLQNKSAEAIGYYHSAIAIDPKSYANRSFELQELARSYAQSLRALGKVQDAEKIEQKLREAFGVQVAPHPQQKSDVVPPFM